jgi:peptidoglycan hydrolase-like protein with peptidoglycan-binding domain
MLLSLALLLPGLAQAGAQKSGKAKSSHSASKRSRRTVKAKKRPRGQQSIDHERVREIQAALIREHYLDGQPNGVWDARSKAAMQKFQADQGWQSKVVPDSRALIKLGLGPDHAGLLNPKTAAIQPVPGGGTE